MQAQRLFLQSLVVSGRACQFTTLAQKCSQAICWQSMLPYCIWRIGLGERRCRIQHVHIWPKDFLFCRSVDNSCSALIYSGRWSFQMLNIKKTNTKHVTESLASQVGRLAEYFTSTKKFIFFFFFPWMETATETHQFAHQLSQGDLLLHQTLSLYLTFSNHRTLTPHFTQKILPIRGTQTRQTETRKQVLESRIGGCDSVK